VASAGTRGVTARIVGVLLIIAVSLAALEAGTRYAFTNVSRIEQRTDAEYRAAVRIRPMEGKPSLLLVGNSLLLEAIDFDLLKRLLPAEVRSYRLVIENTRLLDWKYGIRRLLADGSRPDYVVIAVGVTLVLPAQVRGEYSSYYLFRTADLPEIADTLGFDNTSASSLYFARYSLFYAGRNSLRSFVLNRANPAYAQLLHDLATRPATKVDPEHVRAAAEARLGDIRNVAEAYGTKVFFLIPPGFYPVEEAGTTAGAARARVPVLAPVHQGAWPATMFADSFHLNPRGAEEFTRLIVPQLTALLSEDR
jgi:hypothetical protein